jgi:hypothetical protein
MTFMVRSPFVYPAARISVAAKDQTGLAALFLRGGIVPGSQELR